MQRCFIFEEIFIVQKKMLNNIKGAIWSEVEFIKYIDKLFIAWRNEANDKSNNAEISYSAFISLQFVLVLLILDIFCILGRFNPYLSSLSIYELIYYITGIPILILYLYHAVFYYLQRPRIIPFIRLHLMIWCLVLLFIAFSFFGMDFMCKVMRPPRFQIYEDCMTSLSEVFIFLFMGLLMGFVGICYYFFTFPYLLHLLAIIPLASCIFYMRTLIARVIVKYKDIKRSVSSKKQENDIHSDII